MANLNLLDPFVRLKVLEHIKNYENIERKKRSLKDYDVLNDRAYKYVHEKLALQLNQATANSMPIVSNINIAKRVVSKKASIYNTPPKRTYTDLNDADAEVLKELYDKCGFDTSLAKANKYYCMRKQTFIQVVPKDQKIHLRIHQAHNLDVIPDELDPEKAYAYIVSGFDKQGLLNSDDTNQAIADEDDYKAALERYQVWTKELTFVIDGRGNQIGEVLPNPINMLPFIDVSKDKDFEFFVRLGEALADFTIDFNVAWSDLMYIMRMQGFAVGVLKGDPNLKPESMTIGPNRLLFLPQNPENPDSKLDLEFINPSPDLEASLSTIKSLLAAFLSSEGIDLKSVSLDGGGSQSYSSAIERLLAMIEQFEATKEDFDLFKVVEHKVHEITTAWLSLLSGTDKLLPELRVTQSIINSQLIVNFHKPEMIETKSEQLANAKSKIDLGIADRVSVLADIEGISIEQAEEQIQQIDERRKSFLVEVASQGIEQNGPIQEEN